MIDRKWRNVGVGGRTTKKTATNSNKMQCGKKRLPIFENDHEKILTMKKNIQCVLFIPMFGSRFSEMNNKKQTLTHINFFQMKHKTNRFVTITSNANKKNQNATYKTIRNDVLLKTQQTIVHIRPNIHLSQQLPFQLIKSRRTYTQLTHTHTKKAKKMAKWNGQHNTPHWDIKCDNTKLLNTFVFVNVYL